MVFTKAIKRDHHADISFLDFLNTLGWQRRAIAENDGFQTELVAFRELGGITMQLDDEREIQCRLAAGVFQMPMKIFVVALVIGRGFRYFAEGILAVRYGADATRYLIENKLEFTLLVTALLVASYLLTRFIFRLTHHESEPPAAQ